MARVRGTHIAKGKNPMMKSFGRGALLATLLLSSSALSHAEVLSHPGAKVDIDVPARWTQKQDGDVLVISSPDGGVSIVFAVVPEKDVEAVFTALDKKLEQELGAIEWENDGEAADLEINGMAGAEWNGSAKGGEVYVDVVVLDTPTSKDLGIYWFTAAAAEKANQAAVEQIVKGLKPSR
jgi:hypothetical protein